MHLAASDQTVVVALATGTKCLAASARTPTGLLVNDCHAEVLARRALRLWLLAEVQAVLSDQPSLLVTANAHRTASLKPGVSLHLVVTQPPCGDACVADGAAPTGAKRVRCLDGSWKLPQAGDVEAVPEPGVLRRKPGKGHPTLSMSCSDKLLKWACLGLQVIGRPCGESPG